MRPIALSFEATGRGPEATAGRGGDGYPPYDIERFASAEGNRVLRIVLAVAGFEAKNLEVLANHNQLVIRGQQAEETGRTYLHRGIATRRFQRSFLLADGLTVVAANLKDGLLSVDLTQPQEQATRSIAINEAG